MLREQFVKLCVRTKFDLDDLEPPSSRLQLAINVGHGDPFLHSVC